MSDRPDPPGTPPSAPPSPPEPDLVLRPAEPRRETGRSGFAYVWLIPVLALLIAGGIAWRHYAGLGPVIQITLPSGAGIEPGRTPIRFRDVEVGIVEDLVFTEDLGGVVATARMDARIADRLTDSASFWLVRPQISGSGIVGLETVLTGVYLGVDWGEEPGEAARRFEIIDRPPLTPPGAAGRPFRLFAEQGAGAAVGSPVFFKSIEVGRVETKRLSEDFGVIEYEIFVNAPHDARISLATRFWDASGLDVELGAQGVRVRAPSVVSIVRGGISFDTLGTPGEATVAVAAGRPFQLYRSESAARDSLFEAPGDELRLSIKFEESVRGLREGAPVEYRGLELGQVETVTLGNGTSLAQSEILVTIVLQPRRIGLDLSGEEDGFAFFARSIEEGLRARLALGSIVTGAAYIELVDIEGAEPATLDRLATPYPRLPSTRSQLGILRGSVEDILARVQELPVEEVINQVVGLLADIREITSGEDAQLALRDLSATLASARAIASELEQAVSAAQLDATLGDAQGAIASVEAAAAQLPAIIQRLDTIAKRAEEAMAALGADGALSRATLAAIRDIQNAARAIRSLATAIERDPNSIILGR